MDLDFKRETRGFQSPQKVSKHMNRDEEDLECTPVRSVNAPNEGEGDSTTINSLIRSWQDKSGAYEQEQVEKLFQIFASLSTNCENIPLLRELTRLVVKLSAEDPHLLIRMNVWNDMNFMACLWRCIEITHDIFLLTGYISILGNVFATTGPDEAERLETMYNSQQFLALLDQIDFGNDTRSLFRNFMRAMFQFCCGDHVNAASAEEISQKSSEIIQKCGQDSKCAKLYAWIHIKLLERDLLTLNRASKLDFSGFMSPEIREDGVAMLVCGRILQRFKDEINMDLTIHDALHSALEFCDKRAGSVALWVAELLTDEDSAGVFIEMGPAFLSAYDTAPLAFKTDLIALLWILVTRNPESAEWFFQEFSLMDKTIDIINSSDIEPVRQVCKLLMGSLPFLSDSIRIEIQSHIEQIIHAIEEYGDEELDMIQQELIQIQFN